ncbi:MAG: Rab family GTPase [Candidatus Njordarchaeales archaeon]
MRELEIRLKTIVVGEYGVGKTSLCRRFATGAFEEDYKPTIGVDVYTRTIEVPELGLVHLQIWDTAGEERFKKIYPKYWLGAKIALVVFDITSRKTFEAVEEWTRSLREHVGNISMILIGNKIDLEPFREVESSEGVEKAKRLGFLDYIETSAKTGENVSKGFMVPIEHYLKKRLEK